MEQAEWNNGKVMIHKGHIIGPFRLLDLQYCIHKCQCIALVATASPETSSSCLVVMATIQWGLIRGLTEISVGAVLSTWGCMLYWK